MDEEEIKKEYKEFERKSSNARNFIIFKKIFKIIFLTLFVVFICFLLVNKTFTYNLFNNNFKEYFDFLDFSYNFLILEDLFDDFLNVDYLIPIINISIPKTISLAILLLIYILSIKNIINKNRNYNYMDYAVQNITNEIDNKKPTKNPILICLKFIFSILWAMFKIIFFYILSLLILNLVIVIIFDGIVPYFDWFIEFAGGTASGIFLGIFAPVLGLGMILGLLGGGYSGSGKQQSSTLVYDKDGNIDWIMTGVQQDWENEHIYNKKDE